MSDSFGICQAVEGAIAIYFRSARGTGRTTSMIDSLKQGDCVCVLTVNEGRCIQELCKERGFEIEFEVVDARNPGKIFDKCSYQGRYVLDHRWVEEYYRHQIAIISKDIRHFQNEKSGFGEPHLKTRRKAQEMAKWMI